MILGGMVVGQHGLNLLETNETIQLSATVGLIYLMFNAGLEIDLMQFESARMRALELAGFGFVLTELSGVAIGRVADMAWAGAILLCSTYASQTLVADPFINRLGIIRKRRWPSPSAPPFFTDIAARLVLAVLMGSGEVAAFLGDDPVSFPMYRSVLLCNI